MPQDKRRSISYRSFVTCDDPKGIECGAIRRSKMIINSHKKEQKNNTTKFEVDRNQQHLSSSSAASVTVSSSVINKADKERNIRGVTRGLLDNTPVSFQLLEVSKEADNLNHVINSWSKESNKCKGVENYNAKDLLRGALDLQESLVMLGRLQEASSYVLGLSKRQKQKQKLDEEGTFDGMVSGVNSRKSCDEMRNVVRDSLLRQNVITNPIFEEHYDHHRRMVCSPDMLPSTSSSQSSMVHSSNFVPSETSVSSAGGSVRKKGKETSLIVKLMGLESYPSSPRKHTEKEKITNVARPMYDVDSPRAKRAQFGAQDVGVRQRSVEEILEKLKFKGLLKNSSPDSDVSSTSNNWFDENPPIVVMKPLRYPCIDLDESSMQKFWGEADMKPRYSRGSAQENVRNEGLDFSEKYEVAGGVDCEGKDRYTKKVASAKAKASVNQHTKPQKKQAEVKKVSECEKVAATRRKGEEKKDAKSSDQLISRDDEKFSTTKNKRQKDGKSITKNQSSNQQKTSSTSMSDHRKRGTSERKKNRQPASVLEEKQISRGDNKESKGFHEEVIDSRGDKNSVFPTVNSIIGDKIDIERCQIQIRDYDIDSRSKLLDASEGILYVPSYDDSQSAHSEITSVSTSECCTLDQLGEGQSPLHEVTLITTHENGIAVHHGTNQEADKSLEDSMGSSEKTDDETLRQCLTPRTKLKALLVSNQLFVNHVEELFNIQVNPDSVPCVVDDNDQDVESTKLLVDCANEVMRLERSQFLQACVPLPRMYTTKSRCYISLDQLLEEVCNDIEDLSWYLRPVSDEDLNSDEIYILLERDLKLKSTTWEVGWRSMHTQDEVEQVVSEVDKFLLGKLIEEVISDFMR